MVQERTAIGNDTTTTTYLVGPRGPEISLQDDGTNESIRWYVYDGLGSVIAEVGDADTSNNNPVKSIRTYNVFGGEHSSDQLSGETPSKHKFVGSLGHTSDDTGLIYMRARYYDPSVGRFISQDAKAIGGNWYAYCCNDPLDDVDADGNIPMSPDEARATVECGYGLSLIGAFCFIEIDPWLWATGMSLIIAGAGMMAVGMMANTEANHNPVFNAMLLPLVGAISSIAAGRALLGVENPVQAYVISYVVSVTVYTAVALIS